MDSVGKFSAFYVQNAVFSLDLVGIEAQVEKVLAYIGYKAVGVGIIGKFYGEIFKRYALASKKGDGIHYPLENKGASAAVNDEILHILKQKCGLPVARFTVVGNTDRNFGSKAVIKAVYSLFKDKRGLPLPFALLYCGKKVGGESFG
jgi:hypothetical protein